MMKFKRTAILLGMALILIIGMNVPAAAQDDKTVVTVTAPEWMEWQLEDDALIQKFEETYPGYTMLFVPDESDVMSLSQPAWGADINEYLDGLEGYVSLADTVWVNPYVMTPESVAAGYFLNLTPLVQTDVNLDIDDYYRGAWEYYQWDGGMWAFPMNAYTRFVAYEPSLFDAAGVSYPTESWELEDFVNASNALTQREADGSLITPGVMLSISEPTLFKMFLQQGFYDDSVIPAAPRLDSPDLAAFMEHWLELEEQEVFNQYEFTGAWDAIPLRIESLWILTEDFSQSDQGSQYHFEPSLMPGGVAEISSDGFGVSSGTRQPEMAYNLAKFLADESAVRYGGGESARRSINQDPGPEAYVPQLSAENAAFLDNARDNAITLADLRYGDYVSAALNKMREEDIDATTALQEAQQMATDNLQAAIERSQTTVIEVAPPPAPPELAPGEIALNFGLGLNISPLPNREAWEQLIDDFVANDPQVGYVDLDTNFYGPQDEEDIDCMYLSYSPLQDANSDLPTLFRSLDPFIDADPDFDPNDFIADTLEQGQRDGMTWGYPITLQPYMMMADLQAMNDLGIPVPPANWTIEEFISMLNDIKAAPVGANGEEFVGYSFNGGSMEVLMMMAALGGLPLDYRETPPTVNFTDPEVISAIQTALDLAKSGLITYNQLSNFGPNAQMSGGGFFQQPLIYLTPYYPYVQTEIDEGRSAMFTYPTGRMTPVQYQVGYAFISANSQNPEACYNLIKTVSARPDLFVSMPVRESQITDPVISAANGPQMTEIYQQMADRMNDPNTVSFNYNGGSTPADWLENQWLFTIFDKYVLGEDPIDLETELARAQDYTLAFRECAAGLPPYPPMGFENEDDAQDFFQGYVDCGTSVDPEFQNPFGQ